MKQKLKYRLLALFLMLTLLISNINFKQFHADVSEIPEGQYVYITNYTIGNITSIPNDYVPAKSIEAKGYTAYIKTESSGQRFFSESTGYDASFKTLIDGGRPYPDSILSKNAFGATTNKECPVVENQYFTENHIIKLESVAKACGHLDQIQTLWVYVYKDGTKINSYKQQCAPIEGGTHHVDIVDFFYKIPESGNYTIKVQGKCMGCPGGHSNGLSVLPKIYVEEPFIINYDANGGIGGPTSSTTIYGTGNIDSSTPVKTGYTFKGWSLDNTWNKNRITYSSLSSAKDGSNAIITSDTWTRDNYFNALGRKVTGNEITLYAQWEINTYNITYNGNGHTSGNTYAQSFEYGNFVNIANNGFSKLGYAFTGWNTKADGSGITYNEGSKYTTNAELTLYAQWSKNPLIIDAIPKNDGFGSVTIDWSTYDYANKNFKVYKSEDGSKYESVGIDYTLVDEVKVLNIYPESGTTVTFTSSIDNKKYTVDTRGQLKKWMEEANSESTKGYGKGIIKVDAVSMSKFNKDPSGYLFDDNEEYKYDVIVVGFADMNGSQTFSDATVPYIEEWIKAGKGIVLGHDTIASWRNNGTTIFDYRLNFIKLEKYFNIKAIKNGATEDGVTGSSSGTVNTTYITKKGLMTNYPWSIGDIGTILTIPNCHSSGQIAYGDVWMTLGSDYVYATDEIGITNSYVTTYNNCSQIQTGHSGGAATSDEQKVLANLIFYMNQLLFNTYTTNDMSAQDYSAPEAPIIKENNNVYSFSTKDLGNDYHYYVESYDKNDTTETGLLETSNVDIVHVETGLKGYYYVANNDSSTIVTKNNIFTEDSNLLVSEIAGNKYLHVAAVDNAGNLSDTTTIELHYENIYTITLNNQGATTEGSTTYYEKYGINNYKESTCNNVITKITIPTKTGYTFKGYYTSTNGNGIQYIDENGNILSKNNTFTSNTTLYANWEIATFKQTIQVRFENADGSFTSYQNVIDKNYNIGETVSWSRPADATYKAASITSYTVTGAKTTQVTVYRNTYTVTLNKGTGIASVTQSGNGTYRAGSSVTINATASTGYSWSKWTGTHNTTTNNYTFTITQNVTDTANATINQYTITCIDKIVDNTGKELGSSTWKADYGTTASGATQGTDKTLGKYYTGFYYDSYTTAKVTENGATVYRYFKSEQININGTVEWENDVFEGGNMPYRPKTVELQVFQGNNLVEKIILDTTKTKYISKLVDKYDKNGNLYTYTVKQVFDNPFVQSWNSKIKGYETISAYKTTQTGYDFTNTLNDIGIPVLPEYTYTLTVQLDFNNSIDWKYLETNKSNMKTLVTLKRLVSTTENGEIKYSNEYDGIEINTFANENKTTISNVLAGKYEITVSNEILDLDTITLANSDSMTISKENGKYYITITPVTRNTNGDIIIKHIYNNHYGYMYNDEKKNLYK